MCEVKIYLTNLGKYNEGELIGEWLSLPASEEEIEKTLANIGISDEPDENGRYYEEWFITDYESNIGISIGEYDDVYALNSTLEEIEDADETAVRVLLEDGYDLDEVADKIDDVCYICTPSTFETDEEAVAYYFIHECGCLDIPENLQNYFDYESYGRDIMLEGRFYNIDGDIYEIMD